MNENRKQRNMEIVEERGRKQRGDKIGWTKTEERDKEFMKTSSANREENLAHASQPHFWITMETGISYSCFF